MELLFGSLKALHLFFEDLVDVCNGTTLVLELGGEGRKLICENSNLTFRDLDFFILLLKALSNLDKLALLALDLPLGLLVGFFLTLEALQVLLMLVLLAFEPALSVTVLYSSLVDKLITSARVLNGILPLKVKLVALLMDAFEFFGGLVELNLCSLSLSDFLFELLGLAGDLDCKLFDLEGELLDLGLISASELLEREVIFFFLARGKGPLLQFFLVPVHLKLKLVHAFVSLKDHVLNVVESVLLISNSLLQLLDLVSETARLALSDLL